MSQNLAEYIKRYVDISAGEMDVFESYLIEKKIKKKEFLLSEGHTCRSRYFITKGCVMMYYIDPKANEQIIHFGIDNWKPFRSGVSLIP